MPRSRCAPMARIFRSMTSRKALSYMYQRTPQFAPVRQPWLAIAAGLLALATAHAAAAGESAAFGFSPAQFPRQQALEQRFDAELNPTDLRAWLQRLSSEANHVGSPHDKANAEFIRDLLRQWGWDAQIEVFEVLYPTLRAHSLELVAPVKFTASLREPSIEGDATSTRTDGLPPYNEYGADGDVTGQLVYLNYGMPADYKELARLGVSEARTILKIPVLPISYADAQPLLAALEGPVAPRKWRGALPITYHVGPGPATVHLSISSDWGLKPLYDVIAKIRGADSSDEWVVRGNHRDGWVFGAWDPLSGQGALLSQAKAIGALLKSGSRPRRTFVYASWDGDEAGLLRSPERAH